MRRLIPVILAAGLLAVPVTATATAAPRPAEPAPIDAEVPTRRPRA